MPDMSSSFEELSRGSYQYSTPLKSLRVGFTRGSRPEQQMMPPKTVPSKSWSIRTSKRADKSCPASTRNFMERLPFEILMKILTYLDDSSLFSISHASKLLYRLANDNNLWSRIYMAKFGQCKKLKPQCTEELQKATEEEAHNQGYWKRLYFRTLATCNMNKWKRHLGQISSHTGLPRGTEQVIRGLPVTWELTVFDKSGRERIHELSCSQFCETSATLSWSGGGCFPNYQQISILQLHGVRRIDLNCPGLKEPCWRSLMAKFDMQSLTQRGEVIGQDRLIELMLLQPGIVIGIWKSHCSIAFFMFTLHFHRLVERSTRGSYFCPYMVPTVNSPFDDIDPEYGLHGYQLHLVLHNTVCEIMSGSFSQLYCRKTQIVDGHIQLTAISRTDLQQHTPLSGSFNMAWRCEALQGTVQNCCIMSLTLLDEFGKPFWCVSSPVSSVPQKTSVSYDYDGDHFLMHYKDSDGQVKMELVRTGEEGKFFLISLVVYVAVSKVNEHFNRSY
ncbi:uncharacterized protein V6R79_012480 [Siganus canaliculatus]